MFPMQHPGQFAALHCAAATHAPLLHVSFAPHALHAAPPPPHAWGVVAITQLLPTQQPAQFAAEHVVGCWQVRSAPQRRPVPAQFWQLPP
jgi:hypothetical protein